MSVCGGAVLEPAHGPSMICLTRGGPLAPAGLRRGPATGLWAPEGPQQPNGSSRVPVPYEDHICVALPANTELMYGNGANAPLPKLL